MSEIIAAKIQGIEADLRTTLEYLNFYKIAEETPDEYIQIYEGILNSQLATDRSQKAKAAGSKAETLVEFERIYAREIAEKLPDVKSTKKYKEFVDMANQIRNHDERAAAGSTCTRNLGDDMEIQHQVDECIDPWSKQPAENPVKNTACGHYYDKSSVEERLLQNPTMKCPYTGCANRQIIRMENLIEDSNFKLQLDRMRIA